MLFPSCFREDLCPKLSKNVVSDFWRLQRRQKQKCAGSNTAAVLCVVPGCDVGTGAGAQVRRHPSLSSLRKKEMAPTWTDTCWALMPKRPTHPCKWVSPAACSSPPLSNQMPCLKGPTFLPLHRKPALKCLTARKTWGSTCLTSHLKNRVSFEQGIYWLKSRFKYVYPLNHDAWLLCNR